MLQALIRELDFEAILEIIAAHAQTELGRFLISGELDCFNRETVGHRVKLSREYARLLEEGDGLSFSGLDNVRQWLEPETMMPSEAKELMLLLAMARRVAAARKRLFAAPEELSELRALGNRLPDTSELIRWASPRLGRDGRIPDQASPGLAAARKKITRLRGSLIRTLEGLRKSHGPAVSDAPATLRRDRYCLPVKASSRAQIPGLLLDHSSSGATSFIEPFGAVELNNDLTSALSAEREEVRRILNEISAAFAAIQPELAAAADILGLLDALQAAQLFGRRIHGRLIEAEENSELILLQARHPLLDERLGELRASLAAEKRGNWIPDTRKAVPLDFRMPKGARSLVISGPNAGGKTVVLKTIGVMILMAYHGIPLPVAEGSSVPWLDHLWCHIGDDQDVSADLSTFSGAMTNTARMLDQAGENSLIICDELGTGTDPMEGAALGCSILEELSRRGALSIVTTHLAAIAMAASSATDMANAAMEYDEEKNCPTYRLRMGRPGRSRGLEIAESVGVPESVTARAKELLGGQHLELDRALRKLEEVEAQTLREKDAALLERIRMESERVDLKRQQQKLTLELEALPLQLREEREKLRRDTVKRLDRALAVLDEATREQRHLGKRSRQHLRDEALKDSSPPPAPPRIQTELSEGMEVRIHSLGKCGRLQQLRGHQAQVLVGSNRLWIPKSDLEALPESRRGPTKAQKAEVRIESAEDVQVELMLLGLDSTEARERLERFVDQADTAGVRMVRIVHGHGSGTLRRMVQDALREHPAVSSFSHPPRNRGGTGATEAMLRE